MSIESVMPSNHLVLCCPLLLLPSIFPSIRVFSNESVLCIRWPKYWSFRFSISPSNEYSGLISFRMDWLDFLAVQGTLKSLLQQHSSKASILLCLAFFMVELSPGQWCTEKTSGIVTGNIFLICDKLLKVEELAVRACANFINDCEFQVCKTALGTCLPALVSVKKMLKESSLTPVVLSLGIWPWTGCHVPGGRATSQQCWSGHHPGQHRWRCTDTELLFYGCPGMAERRKWGCCFI